jgi:hypothetical protein
MTPGSKLLLALALLAEGAYWIWLFINSRHGHYPVSFIGWTSLICDPIIFVILVIAFFSDRKYRGKDL